MGPMTGRGAGFCAEFGAPGYMNPYPGGFRRGGSLGSRGWRNRYYATGMPGWARGFGWGGYAPYADDSTPQDELHFLKTQAEVLKNQLEEIEKRISEMAASEDSK